MLRDTGNASSRDGPRGWGAGPVPALGEEEAEAQALAARNMERFRAGYGGEEAGDQQARQQARHYQLLSDLQALVKDLPSSSQQRLSYTILSDLALALIDGTVFEIVQGLLEIQHLTEKNLYNQRLKLHHEHRVLKQEMLHKHKEDQQCCKPHNMPLLKAAQQRELEAMEQRLHEEQRRMDEKIVLELDQKVIDQQSTLEKAGVSGFYVTTNTQELTLQMNLLELIQKLQQKKSLPRRPFT
ncbi:protein DGCR6-like [Sphaerodactylus townsendi]|uniref:Protein dgcr6 n=1 Tax=Sphaerodactylus townsendi TaxID=933632 RepID=A0ACB8FY35_9SAUR|nr:protein DGCR6-like [Sphaerodactylus townsendi]